MAALVAKAHHWSRQSAKVRIAGVGLMQRPHFGDTVRSMPAQRDAPERTRANESVRKARQKVDALHSVRS